MMTSITKAFLLVRCSMVILAVSAQTTLTPAPTQLNFTSDEPTTSPSMRNLTLTPTISSIPSASPFVVGTAMPSDMSSTAPTAVVSASPSISPKPTSMITMPTKAPTRKPTGVPSTISSQAKTDPPVATEKVSTVIDGIQITFPGVSTIPTADLLTLQAIMEEWFEAYYNEFPERYLYKQRQQPHHYRSLQVRVPAIRNMTTIVVATAQDTATTKGSNTLIYTQSLNYVATNNASKTEDYVLLPFFDSDYKNVLLACLSSEIDSFADLNSISTPVITQSTVEQNNGVSIGGIIGIVFAAVSGVVLMVYLGYRIGKQEHSTPVERPNSNENENGMKEMTANTQHVQSMNAGNEQQQNMPVASNENLHRPDPPAQTNDHVLTYKDQARSVVNPIVEATPQPNIGSSTNPIAPPTNDHVLTYKDQARSVVNPIVEAVARPASESTDRSNIPVASSVRMYNA